MGSSGGMLCLGVVRSPISTHCSGVLTARWRTITGSWVSGTGLHQHVSVAQCSNRVSMGITCIKLMTGFITPSISIQRLSLTC
jgi:hypothetical protein